MCDLPMPAAAACCLILGPKTCTVCACVWGCGVGVGVCVWGGGGLPVVVATVVSSSSDMMGTGWPTCSRLAARDAKHVVESRAAIPACRPSGLDGLAVLIKYKWIMV